MALTYAEAKEQFMGIGFHRTTFAPKSGIAATDIGKLGSITGIAEWGLGTSGDAPAGVLQVFETDMVGVQDAGYVEISIVHDATPANEVQNGGWVQCDGAGLGAKSATATGVKAIAVDATNHKAIVKIG